MTRRIRKGGANGGQELGAGDLLDSSALLSAGTVRVIRIITD